MNAADAITGMQNATNHMKAKEPKVTGEAQELGQDAFLTLMLEQLKYQDPLEPMGNEEFLAQQAQFTQVNELQKLNDSMNVNNQIMQASSLIGKEVTIMDPDDNSKRITGIVNSANFSGSQATIVVNGKDYPLGYIITVAQPGSSTGTEDGGTDSGEQDGSEDKTETTT